MDSSLLRAQRLAPASVAGIGHAVTNGVGAVGASASVAGVSNQKFPAVGHADGSAAVAGTTDAIREGRWAMRMARRPILARGQVQRFTARASPRSLALEQPMGRPTSTALGVLSIKYQALPTGRLPFSARRPMRSTGRPTVLLRSMGYQIPLFPQSDRRMAARPSMASRVDNSARRVRLMVSPLSMPFRCHPLSGSRMGRHRSMASPRRLAMRTKARRTAKVAQAR